MKNISYLLLAFSLFMLCSCHNSTNSDLLTLVPRNSKIVAKFNLPQLIDKSSSRLENRKLFLDTELQTLLDKKYSAADIATCGIDFETPALLFSSVGITSLGVLFHLQNATAFHETLTSKYGNRWRTDAGVTYMLLKNKLMMILKGDVAFLLVNDCDADIQTLITVLEPNDDTILKNEYASSALAQEGDIEIFINTPLIITELQKKQNSRGFVDAIAKTMASEISNGISASINFDNDRLNIRTHAFLNYDNEIVHSLSSVVESYNLSTISKLIDSNPLAMVAIGINGTELSRLPFVNEFLSTNLSISGLETIATEAVKSLNGPVSVSAYSALNGLNYTATIAGDNPRSIIDLINGLSEYSFLISGMDNLRISERDNNVILQFNSSSSFDSIDKSWKRLMLDNPTQCIYNIYISGEGITDSRLLGKYNTLNYNIDGIRVSGISLADANIEILTPICNGMNSLQSMIHILYQSL